MLDSGVLGRVAHPKPSPEVTAWVDRVEAARFHLIIPEIADYEVRRNYHLHGMVKSLGILDLLITRLECVPINTSIMCRAARLWAEARLRGRPTADAKRLDADVILASQAIEASATVATDNVGHLSQFVAVRRWREI